MPTENRFRFRTYCRILPIFRSGLCILRGLAPALLRQYLVHIADGDAGEGDLPDGDGHGVKGHEHGTVFPLDEKL